VEGKVHRWRVIFIAIAVLTVAIGWPISNHVSELRLLRFAPNQGMAAAASADFVTWHLVSLFLSFVTVCLAGVALALAARLPFELPKVIARETEEQKVLAGS
jgi:hypothetical protein